MTELGAEQAMSGRRTMTHTPEKFDGFGYSNWVNEALALKMEIGAGHTKWATTVYRPHRLTLCSAARH